MMTDVWISAAALCATTLLGSLLGFAIKELPHKWNDTVLGYCAGVMLAASTLGLIVPAFEEGGSSMWWLVALGVMGGAAFLNVLDLLTPRLHHITGLDPERHASGTSLSRVMLFVMAIALHKLPEGIAAGVSMAGAEEEAASWGVTLGLSLQNIPEGMVIIAPMLSAGVKPSRTFLIAMLTGVVEVIGTFIGYFAVSIASAILPLTDLRSLIIPSRRFSCSPSTAPDNSLILYSLPAKVSSLKESSASSQYFEIAFSTSLYLFKASASISFNSL